MGSAKFTATKLCTETSNLKTSCSEEKRDFSLLLLTLDLLLMLTQMTIFSTAVELQAMSHLRSSHTKKEKNLPPNAISSQLAASFTSFLSKDHFSKEILLLKSMKTTKDVCSILTLLSTERLILKLWIFWKECWK